MNETNTEEEIKRLEFDTCSAQRYAGEGKVEEWVHKYLMAGTWTNPGLSRGLKLQKRWWNGPVEVNLADLSRAVGPEPETEYRVENADWVDRISKMAKSMSSPLSIPPLIVEYRKGELSIRDGNTRHGAMGLLGWIKCWVIIWYDTESDYQQHSSLLLKVE